MQYLDFEVRVSASDDGLYSVDVTSPAGEAKGSMRFPFSPATLELELQGVELAVVKSGARTRDIGIAEPGKSPVIRFGKQLFDALFSEQVQMTLRRSQDRARSERKGLRIRLRLECPELCSLPWEFMYDNARGDYVALSTDSPIVRYMVSDRPVEALSVDPPIRVLAMIANPNDRDALDVAHERRKIEDATAKLQEEGTLKLDWLQGSTWRDLQRALRATDYHIFHFVGHGGFDAAADEGVLVFTSETGGSQLMRAIEVGRLLADEESLRLVVLNSCLGAKGSDTNVFSSTSATLVRKGVPAVVAMQYEISDRAAIEFSRSLYETIADGWPIDAAVAEARKAVSMSTRNSLEWGTPVLQMRSPDGLLFRVDKAMTSNVRPQTGRREGPQSISAVDSVGSMLTGRSGAAQPSTAVRQPASKPDPLTVLTPSGQGGSATAPAAAGCVLLVVPGSAADDRLAQAFVDAAGLAGVTLERLQPATENALRQRLAAGGIELLIYVGTGRTRAAAHATLELDSSSGREPRIVNLRHFAAMLSSAAGLRGAVLLGRQGGMFGGFARAVVEQGVPAAMVWEPSELSVGAAMPKAFLQRWREGASWSELARDAHAAEVAGEGPTAPSRLAAPPQ